MRLVEFLTKIIALLDGLDIEQLRQLIELFKSFFSDSGRVIIQDAGEQDRILASAFPKIAEIIRFLLEHKDELLKLWSIIQLFLPLFANKPQ